MDPAQTQRIHELFRLKDTFYNNEDQVEVGTRSIFTYLPNAGSTLALGFELNRKDFDYTIAQKGLDTLYVFDRADFALSRS